MTKISDKLCYFTLGDNMNKKALLIVMLMGIVFASFLLYKYKSKDKGIVNTETVYLIQIGAYQNYENVVKVTKTLPNYVIIEEDGTAKIIVGITKDDNNLEKLKQNYENIYIREEQIDNKEFLDYLTKYDYLLNETNNSETIKEINHKVLNKYDEIF